MTAPKLIRLEPQPPLKRAVTPAMPDHDPGDEHMPTLREWWAHPMTGLLWRTGPCWIGIHPSLFYAYPPEPDHDAGDEDDYYNYLPSVHPGLGLRAWAPREGR